MEEQASLMSPGWRIVPLPDPINTAANEHMTAMLHSISTLSYHVS